MRRPLSYKNGTVAPMKLSLITEGGHNVRLFFDEDDLIGLREVYRRFRESGYDEQSVTLPSPPDLRWRGEGKRWEILSGHRRLYAATLEGVAALPCRLFYELSDEEAYEFIAAANLHKDITPIELAVRAHEMSLMGYSASRIAILLGGLGGGVHRYRMVGQLVDKGWFVDGPKPSVTIMSWYEAALLGPEHFERCFANWNFNRWDDEECRRYFRKQGKVLPQDNELRGVRIGISKDGTVLKMRGTIDLDMYGDEELVDLFLARFPREWKSLILQGIKQRDGTGFGDGGGKKIYLNYSPDTLDEEFSDA